MIGICFSLSLVVSRDRHSPLCSIRRLSLDSLLSISIHNNMHKILKYSPVTTRHAEVVFALVGFGFHNGVSLVYSLARCRCLNGFVPNGLCATTNGKPISIWRRIGTNRLSGNYNRRLVTSTLSSSSLFGWSLPRSDCGGWLLVKFISRFMLIASNW